MITISVICIVLVSITNGVKVQEKCVVDPIENQWPGRSMICQERIWTDTPSICNLQIDPYDHQVIEEALAADIEQLQYLNDVIKIYRPELPYPVIDQCPVDTGVPNAEQIVNCEKICPSSYVNVTVIAHEYEPGSWTKCYVVRPWDQVVYYMQCGTKYPLVDGMDDSFQCVPEDIIRRRIAVYCPKIVPQCRKVDVDLPQHCAASKFQCKPKKVSKSDQINSLFESSGLFL